MVSSEREAAEEVPTALRVVDVVETLPPPVAAAMVLISRETIPSVCILRRTTSKG
jgi:hypothetical protein